MTAIQGGPSVLYVLMLIKPKEQPVVYKQSTQVGSPFIYESVLWASVKKVDKVP